MSKISGAVMYMIAAAVFLLVAVLGSVGGETVFLVLAMAFVVLSLNALRSTRKSGSAGDLGPG